MRPRQIAAENVAARRNPAADTAGFNEAAANRRGKPGRRRRGSRGRPASMRPRQIAAENDTEMEYDQAKNHVLQ